MIASLESRYLISCRFETGSLGGIFVADIFHACLSANKKPFETSTYCFDDVPWVESVHESFAAKRSATVGRLWVWKETCGGF